MALGYYGSSPAPFKIVRRLARAQITVPCRVNGAHWVRAGTPVAWVAAANWDRPGWACTECTARLAGAL